MLRSAKEVKDWDYGKIFLRASEVDSLLLRKVRQMYVEMLSSSASNKFESRHLATITAPNNAKQKSFGLPAKRKWRKILRF